MPDKIAIPVYLPFSRRANRVMGMGIFADDVLTISFNNVETAYSLDALMNSGVIVGLSFAYRSTQIIPQLEPTPTVSLAKDFKEELRALINCHSLENRSDTPDYILSSFLESVLVCWNEAIRAREQSRG